MIPLETVPLYSADSYPNRYWTAQRNTTEWSMFMKELTTSGNAIARLQLQALTPTLHGAHVGKPALPGDISDPEMNVDAHYGCMYALPQAYLTRIHSSRTCLHVPNST